MTNELIKSLTDMKMLIEDWNAKAIPTEVEFIEKLQKINTRIVFELGEHKESEIGM